MAAEPRTVGAKRARDADLPAWVIDSGTEDTDFHCAPDDIYGVYKAIASRSSDGEHWQNVEGELLEVDLDGHGSIAGSLANGPVEVRHTRGGCDIEPRGCVIEVLPGGSICQDKVEDARSTALTVLGIKGGVRYRPTLWEPPNHTNYVAPVLETVPGTILVTAWLGSGPGGRREGFEALFEPVGERPSKFERHLKRQENKLEPGSYATIWVPPLHEPSHLYGEVGVARPRLLRELPAGATLKKQDFCVIKCSAKPYKLTTPVAGAYFDMKPGDIVFDAELMAAVWSSAHWSLSCKGSQCPIWCTKMSGRQRRVVVPVTAVLIAGLTMDAALLKKRGKLSQSRATLAVQEKAVAMDYMDRFRLMIEIGHREQEYFDVALREHQRSTASGDGDD